MNEALVHFYPITGYTHTSDIVGESTSATDRMSKLDDRLKEVVHVNLRLYAQFISQSVSAAGPLADYQITYTFMLCWFNAKKA